MEPFSLLFSPIKIGRLEIRNRIVMAPMTTGYANEDGDVSQTLIDFYLERANGGVGLITCESCYVDRGGKGFLGQLSLENDDYIPGLQRLTESVKSTGAKIVLQLIHCGRQASSALCGGQAVAPSPIPSMHVEQGSLVHLAEGIKEAVTIPVFAVGGINDPVFAGQVLVKGKADMVALRRALLADPEWPAKAQRGEKNRIRPCIYCNHCRNRALRPKINCAVNYETGRETELGPKRKADEPKNVIIIGGGISGMEAAYVSAERGHNVTVYERTDGLGGNLLLASIPPKRGRLLEIVEFLRNEIERLGVEVILETQASLEEIRGLKSNARMLKTFKTDSNRAIACQKTLSFTDFEFC